MASYFDDLLYLLISTMIENNYSENKIDEEIFGFIMDYIPNIKDSLTIIDHGFIHISIQLQNQESFTYFRYTL